MLSSVERIDALFFSRIFCALQQIGKYAGDHLFLFVQNRHFCYVSASAILFIIFKGAA
jgi:hypothetical protein